MLNIKYNVWTMHVIDTYTQLTLKTLTFGDNLLL
jgi:hypothetical protein